MPVKPTIAVLGHSGMAGHYITTYLQNAGYRVVLANRFDAAAVTAGELLPLIAGLPRGAVVINCIGLISQRKDVTAGQLEEVNGRFPHRLQEACEAAGARLIHLSTDCVFSGRHGLYAERHAPDPADGYGRSKHAGEPPGAMVVRTSLIGSERKQKLSLLEWVKSNRGKEAPGYVNHYWNGVTCLQLAEFFERILAEESYWRGVRHYHSPRDISKYELVQSISGAYGLGVTVNPFAAAQPVNRTLRSLYPFPPAPDIAEQLRELASFDEKNGLHGGL